MNETLRQYLDSLFADAPQTMRMVELKEEILQNLTDKYNDLIAEGKDPEAAYNIAVASVGDVQALIREQAGAGVSAEEREKVQRRSALLVSIAIMLYIVAVVPVILIGSTIGVCIMFALAAIATGMLIYNGATRPRYLKTDNTVVEDFKAWKVEKSGKNRVASAMIGAMWILITTLYLLISFLTNAWYISWLIFPFGGALSLILSGIFDLKK